MTGTADPATAREAVARNPLWYHTIDVAPGVWTPGVFDLRSVVGRLPWPDVRGKRCLDVGTYDGFLAFELERRGAAEVVATDISDHAEWDHEVRLGGQSTELLEEIAGEKGAGFDIAHDLLGSSVVKRRSTRTTSRSMPLASSTWWSAAACCFTCAIRCERLRPSEVSAVSPSCPWNRWT